MVLGPQKVVRDLVGWFWTPEKVVVDLVILAETWASAMGQFLVPFSGDCGALFCIHLAHAAPCFHFFWRLRRLLLIGKVECPVQRAPLRFLRLLWMVFVHFT